jgi:hypothetical protein
MTAPLGSRICPNLGCSRRIHVSPSGTVYARCLAHSLMLLSGVFAAPSSGERGVPPRASLVTAGVLGSPARGHLAGSHRRGGFPDSPRRIHALWM